MAIIERLRSDSSAAENVSVVPIVGIGGLGKTTLVRFVYNDDHTVVRGFEVKMWVCISDDFSLGAILRRALLSEENNLEMLQRDFRNKIEGKKYFLVLDDVWDSDLKKWMALKDLLIRGARGSRIIVTTQLNDVAIKASKSEVLRLQGMSASDSWCLFKKIVFDGQEPEHEHVKEIGMKIIEKCAGIPLAILTIGSLLYSKSPEFKWSDFMEAEFSKLPQEANDIMPILQLSYNHLSSPLKHCFAYCKLFPKDYQIDVRSLVHQWIAQGFTGSSQGSKCVEDIGYDYFEDLLGRSFFQEPKMDDLGNRMKCKMHDLMHDLATSVEGEETIVFYTSCEHFSETSRHISFDHYFCSSSLDSFLPTILKAKKAHTFLFLQGSKFEVTEAEVDKVVSKLKRLYVLDLRSSGIKRIPNSIGELRHLRVLDFSNNRFYELPNSITQLLNLQTLQLERCYFLQKLPRDIDRLVNLRHLNCDGCSTLSSMPQAIEKLTSLRMLKGFKVAKGKEIADLKSLKCLNDLRGSLKIKDVGLLSDSEAADFKEKHHLQSLELYWDKRLDAAGVDDDHDKLSLQSISLPPNLKYLMVYGYPGIRFPIWYAYLRTIVDIRLRGWERCMYFLAIDKMPCLQTLWIYDFHDMEFIEFESRSGSSFFPSLKRFYVSRCQSLKGWRRKGEHNTTPTAELPYFQSLTELFIDQCKHPIFQSFPVPPKLEKLTVYSYEGASFPSWVSFLTSIEDIELHNWRSCKNIPPLDQIISLRRLSVRNFYDLEHIDIFGGSTFFPLLKNLELFYCPNLKGWWKDGIDAETTAISEMPQFHSLSNLKIYGCPRLTMMPLFPTLDDELQLDNVEPLIETMKMMVSPSRLASTFAASSSASMRPLSSLKKLKLMNEADFLALKKIGLLENVTHLESKKFIEKEVQFIGQPSAIDSSVCANDVGVHISGECPEIEEVCVRGGIGGL